MRTVSVVLVLMMVGLSLCIHNNNQQKIEKEGVMEKLKKSHFGKAILQMLELNEKVGADFGPLFSAIDNLKTSILTKKQTESEDFQNDGVAHENEVQRLSGLIQTYGQEVQTYTEDLETLVAFGEQLKNDLNSQETRLEHAGQEKNFEQKFLEDLKANFERDSDDYGKALAILDLALEALDEAAGFHGKALSSFLQSKTNTFQDMSQNLKSIDQLNKIGDQSFYVVPIAEVFAQLAKGDDLDISAITQARNALIDLKNFLLQGLDNLKGTFNTAFKEHTDVFEKLTNEINTLKNLTIPQTQRDIQGNADGQIEKQSQLDDARTNLAWTKSQLGSENNSWDMRVQLNALLMPQFDSEYAIVVQAEAIIKNAQKNGQV